MIKQRMTDLFKPDIAIGCKTSRDDAKKKQK